MIGSVAHQALPNIPIQQTFMLTAWLLLASRIHAMPSATAQFSNTSTTLSHSRATITQYPTTDIEYLVAPLELTTTTFVLAANQSAAIAGAIPGTDLEGAWYQPTLIGPTTFIASWMSPIKYEFKYSTAPLVIEITDRTVETVHLTVAIDASQTVSRVTTIDNELRTFSGPPLTTTALTISGPRTTTVTACIGTYMAASPPMVLTPVPVDGLLPAPSRRPSASSPIAMPTGAGTESSLRQGPLASQTSIDNYPEGLHMTYTSSAGPQPFMPTLAPEQLSQTSEGTVPTEKIASLVLFVGPSTHVSLGGNTLYNSNIPVATLPTSAHVPGNNIVSPSSPPLPVITISGTVPVSLFVLEPSRLLVGSQTASLDGGTLYIGPTPIATLPAAIVESLSAQAATDVDVMSGGSDGVGEYIWRVIGGGVPSIPALADPSGPARTASTADIEVGAAAVTAATSLTETRTENRGNEATATQARIDDHEDGREPESTESLIAAGAAAKLLRPGENWLLAVGALVSILVSL